MQKRQTSVSPHNGSIYIASSPWFVGLATTCYATIGIALWLLAWPWLIRFVLALWLIFDYRLMLKIYGFRNHPQAVAILLRDCDKWLYQLQSGKRYKGRLIKRLSFCSSFVLVLYIRGMNGGRYVLVPRDALSTRNYRYLALQINNIS